MLAPVRVMTEPAVKATAHAGHIDIQIDAHHAVLTADQADDLTAAIAEAQMTAAAQRAAAADRLEYAGKHREPPFDVAAGIDPYAIPSFPPGEGHRQPLPVSPEVGGPFYAASADAPDYQHPEGDDD